MNGFEVGGEKLKNFQKKYGVTTHSNPWKTVTTLVLTCNKKFRQLAAILWI